MLNCPASRAILESQAELCPGECSKTFQVSQADLCTGECSSGKRSDVVPKVFVDSSRNQSQACSSIFQKVFDNAMSMLTMTRGTTPMETPTRETSEARCICEEEDYSLDTYSVDDSTCQTAGCKIAPTAIGAPPRFHGGAPTIPTVPSEKINFMKTITDLADKEKQMKNQIQDLQTRETTYKDLLKNFQQQVRGGAGEKHQGSCMPTCPCALPSSNLEDEFARISNELKLENKQLKAELMEMKIELKHCLDRIEGPMQNKLEAEKCKCMQLQNDLQKSSQNMMMNQDSHAREMSALKRQLCDACNNLMELNTMNTKLKGELGKLDCICSKLEDDLIKQKVNEAETLKRLKHERPCLCVDSLATSKSSFKCDENLHVIARKLSQTLKDSEPCKECAKLPSELAGAAKCIKDLTDMVVSRASPKKDAAGSRMTPVKDCDCQSLPTTQEECCQCNLSKAPHGVDVSSKTETLFQPVDLLDQDSSRLGSKVTPTANDIKKSGTSYRTADGVSVALSLDKIIIPTQSKAQNVTQQMCCCVAGAKPMPCTCGDSEIDTSKKPESAAVPTEQSPLSTISSKPTDKASSYTTTPSAPFTFSGGSAGQPAQDLATSVPCKTSIGSGECLPFETITTAPPSAFDQPSSVALGESAIATGFASAQPTIAEITTPFTTGTVPPSDVVSSADATHLQTLPTLQDSTVGVQPAIKPTFTQPHTPGDGQVQMTEPAKVSAGSVKKPTSQKQYDHGTLRDEPFDVDTKVEILDRVPDGVHMSTTITRSGTIEVSTEGPEGLIETTVTYTDEGNIEVLTELTEYKEKDSTTKTQSAPPGTLSSLPVSESDRFKTKAPAKSKEEKIVTYTEPTKTYPKESGDDAMRDSEEEPYTMTTQPQTSGIEPYTKLSYVDEVKTTEEEMSEKETLGEISLPLDTPQTETLVDHKPTAPPIEAPSIISYPKESEEVFVQALSREDIPVKASRTPPPAIPATPPEAPVTKVPSPVKYPSVKFAPPIEAATSTISYPKESEEVFVQALSREEIPVKAPPTPPPVIPATPPEAPVTKVPSPVKYPTEISRIPSAPREEVEMVPEIPVVSAAKAEPPVKFAPPIEAPTSTISYPKESKEVFVEALSREEVLAKVPSPVRYPTEISRIPSAPREEIKVVPETPVVSVAEPEIVVVKPKPPVTFAEVESTMIELPQKAVVPQKVQLADVLASEVEAPEVPLVEVVPPPTQPIEVVPSDLSKASSEEQFVDAMPTQPPDIASAVESFASVPSSIKPTSIEVKSSEAMDMTTPQAASVAPSIPSLPQSLPSVKAHKITTEASASEPSVSLVREAKSDVPIPIAASVVSPEEDECKDAVCAVESIVSTPSPPSDHGTLEKSLVSVQSGKSSEDFLGRPLDKISKESEEKSRLATISSADSTERASEDLSSPAVITVTASSGHKPIISEDLISQTSSMKADTINVAIDVKPSVGYGQVVASKVVIHAGSYKPKSDVVDQGMDTQQASSDQIMQMDLDGQDDLIVTVPPEEVDQSPMAVEVSTSTPVDSVTASESLKKASMGSAKESGEAKGMEPVSEKSSGDLKQSLGKSDDEVPVERGLDQESKKSSEKAISQPDSGESLGDFEVVEEPTQEVPEPFTEVDSVVKSGDLITGVVSETVDGFDDENVVKDEDMAGQDGVIEKSSETEDAGTEIVTEVVPERVDGFDDETASADESAGISAQPAGIGVMEPLEEEVESAFEDSTVLESQPVYEYMQDGKPVVQVLDVESPVGASVELLVESGEPLPTTILQKISEKQSMEPEKRHRFCQSTPVEDKSCSCCVCVSVGISTTQDTETTTVNKLDDVTTMAESQDASTEPVGITEVQTERAGDETGNTTEEITTFVDETHPESMGENFVSAKDELSRVICKVECPGPEGKTRKQGRAEGTKESKSTVLPQQKAQDDKRATSAPTSHASHSKFPPRKKRPSKQDRCECVGVCPCIVCDPEVLAKRAKSKPSPCKCDGAASLIPKKTSSFSPKKICCCHPKTCDCVQCVINSKGDEILLKTTSLTKKSRVSIEDVFKKPMEDEFCICDSDKVAKNIKTRCSCGVDNQVMKPSGSSFLNPPSLISHPSNCDCDQCECGRSIISLVMKHKARDATKLQGGLRRSSKELPNYIPSFLSHPSHCDCSDCTCGIEVLKHNAKKAKETHMIPRGLIKSDHPDDCKCVTCKCIPRTIEDIAQMKDIPTISEEKQVYQVHSIKCNCANAQNARKFAEKSKIPVPINRPGSTDRDKSRHPFSCDCEVCTCRRCGDPNKRPGEEETETEPDKYQSEPQQKTAAVAPTIAEHPDDCVCDACVCQLPKPPEVKSVETHAPDCVCPTCTCPSGPNQPPPVETESKKATPVVPLSQEKHGEDCVCITCVCPSSPKALDVTETPAKIVNDCDCTPTCECGPCADPKIKPKTFPCDCTPNCECLHCADPSKPPRSTPRSQPTTETVTPAAAEEHDPDCCCPVCACNKVLGDKQVPSKPPEIAAAATPPPPPVTPASAEEHDPDCCCPVCACNKVPDGKQVPSKPPEIAATPLSGAPPPPPPTAGGVHPPGCVCATCICEAETPGTEPTPTTLDVRKSPEAKPCKCDVCICEGDIAAKIPIPQVRDIGSPEAISKTPAPAPATAEHDPDCTCQICVCNKSTGQAPPAAAPVQGKAPETAQHPDDCICPLCACAKQIGEQAGEQVREQAGVQAQQSQTDKKHPPGCNCTQCFCPNKTILDIPLAQVPSFQHPEGCTCIICACIKGATAPKVECDLEPHPPDCVCPVCNCEVGVQTSGVVPIASKQTHPPNCACDKCLCEDEEVLANVKPTVSGKPSEKGISIACSCDKCICVDCGAQTGAAVMDPQALESKATVTKPIGHPADCVCPDCICYSTTVEGMIKSPLVVSAEVSAKPPGCSCDDCTCEVCVFKTGGLKTITCSCTGNCMCENCLNMKAGDVAPPMKSALSRTAPPPGVKGDICEHTVECMCDKCICETCNLKPGVKIGFACACQECICVACLGTRGDAQVMAQPTVKTVQIQGQPDEKPKGDMSEYCSCIQCVCDKCDDGVGGGSGGEGPHVTIAPDTPQSPVEAQPSRAADTPQARPQSGLDAAPPPFGLPELRMMCKCGPVCNCYVCTRREGAPTTNEMAPTTSATPAHMSGMSRSHLPPSQEIPCECAACQCPHCKNPESSPMMRSVPSTMQPAAGPSISGTKPVSSGDVPCDCSPPCACDDCPAKPSTPCDCPTCACGDCPDHSKKGGERAVKTLMPASQAASRPDTPILCDCPVCNCKDCTPADTRAGTPLKSDTVAPPSQTVTPGSPKTPSDKENCTCTKCVCESQAGMPPSTTKSSTTKSSTPTSCICKHCSCVDCEAKKHPSSAPNFICTCSPCACAACGDSRAKSQPLEGTPHAVGVSEGGHPDCTCATCQCKICSKAQVKSGVVSARSLGQTGTEIVKGVAHSPDCTCATCQCNICEKAPGTQVVQGQATPGPPETQGQSQPTARSALPGQAHAPDCNCSICQCKICEKSPGTQIVQGQATPEPQVVQHQATPVSQVVQGQATPGDTTEISNILAAHKECICTTCICEVCSRAPGAPKAATESVPGVHSPECTCTNCDYKICGKKSAGDAQLSRSVGLVDKTRSVPTAISSVVVKVTAPGGDECTCTTCNCKNCVAKRSGHIVSGDGTCTCTECKCKNCGKGPGLAEVAGQTSQATCLCATCTCEDCFVKKSKGVQRGDQTSHVRCTCATCICNACTLLASGGATAIRDILDRPSEASGDPKQPKSVTIMDKPPLSSVPSNKMQNISSGPVSAGSPSLGNAQGSSCVCRECQAGKCPKHNKSAISNISSGPVSAAGSRSLGKTQGSTCVCQDCQTGKCPKHNKSATPNLSSVPVSAGSSFKSAQAPPSEVSSSAGGPVLGQSSGQVPISILHTTQEVVTSETVADLPHVSIALSSIRQMRSEEVMVKKTSVPSTVVDIRELDDATLKKEIVSGTKENCQCRQEIHEIMRALNKIKCACTEAELKALDCKKLSANPSGNFGVTMSGLKLALSGLQEKCKAKDKMIQVMIEELKSRNDGKNVIYGDSLINDRPSIDIPDYDKGKDVSTTTRRTKSQKHGLPRKKLTSRCGCQKRERESGRYEGTQTKGMDATKINLSGFEITDIRRITEDSIIIKWKPPPASNLVIGYDIFVNGVNKSKVLSAGRTNAMLHNLDLSATIQITIYAVTKIGRCEPPAIAIYEI